MKRTSLKRLACAAIAAAWAVSTMDARSAPIRADAVVNVHEYLTTAGDPFDNLVAVGAGFDGVSRLTIAIPTVGILGCSAALLSSGRHLLTAAHCVTRGAGVVDGTRASTIFDVPGGPVSIDVDDIFVHDDWNGSLVHGGDLAILELAADAPAGAERYDIYRDDREVGDIGVKVGYGRSGRGDTGHVLDGGDKRAGSQRYDALADVFDGVFFDGMQAASQLAFDFDSGDAANDAFGMLFGIEDTGTGADEVSPAPGDSGGPTFIDGLIAGVTSYGFGFTSFAGTPDVTPGITDSSFGEMAVDTRVSYFSGWIDRQISAADVSEPPPITLGAIGLVLALRRTRRSRPR